MPVVTPDPGPDDGAVPTEFVPTGGAVSAEEPPVVLGLLPELFTPALLAGPEDAPLPADEPVPTEPAVATVPEFPTVLGFPQRHYWRLHSLQRTHRRRHYRSPRRHRLHLLGQTRTTRWRE
jgi:hypothetical protein